MPFYGINTSLSVFLLGATAVLFAVCTLCIEAGPAGRRERIFCRSQVVVFAYLAFDDRFLLHEAVIFLASDIWLLLAAGAVELLLLVKFGDLRSRSWFTRRCLALGIAFFLAMSMIDAFVPLKLFLRLSFEDLSKLWGTVFFFMFAWSICAGKIADLRSRRDARMT